MPPLHSARVTAGDVVLHHPRGEQRVHLSEALEEGAVEGAAGRSPPLGRTLTGGVAQEVHQTEI